jgi:hypothetical protein
MLTLTVVVHEFMLGEVDDPDLYAAPSLWDWQNSEVGEWVMANATETPQWGRQAGQFDNWGYRYRVTAQLTEQDATFFKLKYYDHIKQQ